PTVFGWRDDNFVDKLFGSDRLRTLVDAGAGIDDVIGSWQQELGEFRQRRQRYLIYRGGAHVQRYHWPASAARPRGAGRRRARRWRERSVHRRTGWPAGQRRAVRPHTA